VPVMQPSELREAACLLHPTSVRERVGCDPMLIRISDPDLLVDLCDYLSREGFAFSAVQPGQDWVHVLAAGAETDLAAASLLHLKLNLWMTSHAHVTVSIEERAR